jgi:hypothetical protein
MTKQERETWGKVYNGLVNRRYELIRDKPTLEEKEKAKEFERLMKEVYNGCRSDELLKECQEILSRSHA